MAIVVLIIGRHILSTCFILSFASKEDLSSQSLGCDSLPYILHIINSIVPILWRYNSKQLPAVLFITQV